MLQSELVQIRVLSQWYYRAEDRALLAADSDSNDGDVGGRTSLQVMQSIKIAETTLTVVTPS